MILDTDYTSYSIVYTCSDFLGGLFRGDEDAWVLVRDPIEDGSAEYDAMMDIADDVFSQKVPDYDHWNEMRTTQ